MTPEAPVAALSTREVDRLVALHVMGSITPSVLWSPSIDPYAAGGVLNKMHAEGWSYRISVNADRSHVEFQRRIAGIATEDWGYGEATAGSDGVELAISMAALRAKGVRV